MSSCSFSAAMPLAEDGCYRAAVELIYELKISENKNMGQTNGNVDAFDAADVGMDSNINSLS